MCFYRLWPQLIEDGFSMNCDLTHNGNKDLFKVKINTNSFSLSVLPQRILWVTKITLLNIFDTKKKYKRSLVMLRLNFKNSNNKYTEKELEMT